MTGTGVHFEVKEISKKRKGKAELEERRIRRKRRRRYEVDAEGH